MRQLATIQQIAEKKPIEGADAIEAVRVKDWWCVAKKGEFSEGDLCVYFEIDSLLPVENETFAFLARGSKTKTMVIEGKTYTGYRLKTIKLRGQISQGLALPLSSMFHSKARLYETHDIGHDVSEMLNIVKYEPPIPAQLMGKIKGQRPSYIPKTDEERVQNLGELVSKHQGAHFYITEKLDGSSATFFRHTTTADGDHFGVCSRNLELLETEGNTFWAIARKYNLVEKIPNGYAIQGELVGEGIQNNPLKMKGHDVYVYNVYNIVESRFLNLSELIPFVENIGMKTVPVLLSDYVLETDVEGLLEFAEGKSVIFPEAEREGVVLRPLKESLEVIQGTLQRFSFKAISNKYLLGGGEV